MFTTKALGVINSLLPKFFFFFFLRTLLKFCCETVMLEKMLCPNFILKIKVEMVYFIDEKNFKTKMVCFID